MQATQAQLHSALGPFSSSTGQLKPLGTGTCLHSSSHGLFSFGAMRQVPGGGALVIAAGFVCGNTVTVPTFRRPMTPQPIYDSTILIWQRTHCHGLASLPRSGLSPAVSQQRD